MNDRTVPKDTFYNIFSLSFDAEVLNVFWNAYDKLYVGKPSSLPADPDIGPHPQILPVPGSSSIFRILVSPEGSKTYSVNPLIATIQYTVITSGILVVVGLSSYLTYKFLRQLGSISSIQINRNYVNLISKLKSGVQRKSSHKDLVPQRKALSNSSGFSLKRTNSHNKQPIRKVVSGDESGSDLDEAEIEPQYFGPSPFPEETKFCPNELPFDRYQIEFEE